MESYIVLLVKSCTIVYVYIYIYKTNWPSECVCTCLAQISESQAIANGDNLDSSRQFGSNEYRPFWLTDWTHKLLGCYTIYIGKKKNCNTCITSTRQKHGKTVKSQFPNVQSNFEWVINTVQRLPVWFSVDIFLSWFSKISK